jgi:hypothetical protein
LAIAWLIERHAVPGVLPQMELSIPLLATNLVAAWTGCALKDDSVNNETLATNRRLIGFMVTRPSLVMVLSRGKD